MPARSSSSLRRLIIAVTALAIAIGPFSAAPAIAGDAAGSEAALLEDAARALLEAISPAPVVNLDGTLSLGGLLGTSPSAQPADNAAAAPLLLSGAAAMALVAAPFRNSAQRGAAGADDLLACLAGERCSLLAVPERPSRRMGETLDVDQLFYSVGTILPGVVAASAQTSVLPQATDRPTGEEHEQQPLRALVKLVLRDLGLLDFMRSAPATLIALLLGLVGLLVLVVEVARSRRSARR